METAPRTNEADQVKLDLAKGSNNNTQDNDAHISEHLHIGRGDTESPGREEGDNGVGGLNFRLLEIGLACTGRGRSFV